VSKNRQITRRTVLRGLGAVIALPWLEVMGTAGTQPTAGKPPLRTVFLYHPLGAETTAWKGVTGTGKDMMLTPTLQPLEPVKEHLLVLDGLNGRPHPSSGHNRSACLWLSSAPAGQADTCGAETDITLDQMLAPTLSRGARQPSLELSCTTIGNLMHAMNLSWRAPGVPTGAETNPRDVFARMFGDPKEDARRRSVLDVVAEDARTLKSKLGQGDQRRLDEYLDSVRSLERQIATFQPADVPGIVPKLDLPDRPPPSVRDHIKLMFDVLLLALQTDFTRVITCALGDESEGAEGTTYNRRLVDLGIEKATLANRVDPKYLDWGHHKCSHDPKPTLPIIQAIDRWYVEQLSTFLQRLQASRDGDGTLLDSSLVVYGCTNAGGGSGGGWPGHGLRDVACLLAGKAGGLLPRLGRVIEYYGKERRDRPGDGVPLSNLWLTLLQLTGIERKDFGRSTGTLAGLG
jgi:hypothetical protein